jgi:hypothetical protein
MTPSHGEPGKAVAAATALQSASRIFILGGEPKFQGVCAEGFRLSEPITPTLFFASRLRLHRQNAPPNREAQPHQKKE